MLQFRRGDFRRVKIFWIRPEAQRGTGVALADFADHFEFGFFRTVAESHVVFVTVALDPHFQMLRQRIDHRHAYTVQAAGELVIRVGEFAARVQPRENHFDARDFFDRMQIHRHAAPVIGHLQRAVFVQHHVDIFGVARHCLIHAVVDDFLREMIRPLSLRVHARALAHRFQTYQYFNRCGVVGFAHELRFSIVNGAGDCAHKRGMDQRNKNSGARRRPLNSANRLIRKNLSSMPREPATQAG